MPPVAAAVPAIEIPPARIRGAGITGPLNQRFIAHYNSQCCGIAVEYQKFNFGTRAGTIGVPRDHRFNLSFTLAGIGTFSDLFGAFGGQQGR